MTTQSVSRAMFAQKLGKSSKTLGIPEYPFILVVAFGCFMMFLQHYYFYKTKNAVNKVEKEKVLQKQLKRYK